MFEKTIIIVLLVLLFFGGMGVNLLEIKVLELLISSLIIAIYVINRGGVKIPKYFFLYFTFVLTIVLSFFWAKNGKNTFEYLIYFTNGGLVWLVFYNFPKKSISLFVKGVIFLGLVFGGLYVRSLVTGNIYINSYNLFSPLWYDSSHVHLGDYWMFCLIIIIYYFLNKRKIRSKIILLFLTILGFYFLIASSSRSAIIGLFAGLYYLYSSDKRLQKYKKYSVVLLGILIFIFLFVSSHRSTLYSRGYFIQGFMGFIRKPFGYGLGNFYIVSTDPNNQILGFKEVTSVAHDIFIEMLTGVGVFSFIFIFWVLRILRGLLSEKENIYGAVFLAILVNFCFDFTYLVPTMFWLWFAFLGLTQKAYVNGKKQLSG